MDKTMIMRVALTSSSRVGQVTFRSSSRTPTRNARACCATHPVSLFDGCATCAPRSMTTSSPYGSGAYRTRGQYFRHSTRSGCFRLFLSVKKLRLLALGAFQHDFVAWHVLTSVEAVGLRARAVSAFRLPSSAYFMILVTTPAPTVRPPSRMAKRSPSSIAIGVISSIVICTLSPGITISTPSGSSTLPVTSVVRK